MLIERLTEEQIILLWLMHYGTPEYDKEDRVYGYQFSAACAVEYDFWKLDSNIQEEILRKDEIRGIYVSSRGRRKNV
jgi:hypothetical protein